VHTGGDRPAARSEVDEDTLMSRDPGLVEAIGNFEGPPLAGWANLNTQWLGALAAAAATVRQAYAAPASDSGSEAALPKLPPEMCSSV
jgi:hypothetical protein